MLPVARRKRCAWWAAARAGTSARVRQARAEGGMGEGGYEGGMGRGEGGRGSQREGVKGGVRWKGRKAGEAGHVCMKERSDVGTPLCYALYFIA